MSQINRGTVAFVTEPVTGELLGYQREDGTTQGVLTVPFGRVRFEITDNETLTVSVVGTDGVVRSVDLTLAAPAEPGGD